LSLNFGDGSEFLEIGLNPTLAGVSWKASDEDSILALDGGVVV
jgi:hypothetical protein